MEIKHFRDFEEVEFNLFKNIPLNISSVKDEIRTKFLTLFDNLGLDLFRIVKILDGKVICETRVIGWSWDYKNKQENRKYCVFENKFKLQEGRYILIKYIDEYEQENLDKVWVIENNVLTENFLDKCSEKIEK